MMKAVFLGALIALAHADNMRGSGERATDSQTVEEGARLLQGADSQKCRIVATCNPGGTLYKDTRGVFCWEKAGEGSIQMKLVDGIPDAQDIFGPRDSVDEWAFASWDQWRASPLSTDQETCRRLCWAMADCDVIIMREEGGQCNLFTFSKAGEYGEGYLTDLFTEGCLTDLIYRPAWKRQCQ